MLLYVIVPQKPCDHLCFTHCFHINASIDLHIKKFISRTLANLPFRSYDTALIVHLFLFFRAIIFSCTCTSATFSSRKIKTSYIVRSYFTRKTLVSFEQPLWLSTHHKYIALSDWSAALTLEKKKNAACEHTEQQYFNKELFHFCWFLVLSAFVWSHIFVVFTSCSIFCSSVLTTGSLVRSNIPPPYRNVAFNLEPDLF